MAETKYGHLVKKLNFQERPYGKAAVFGGSDLEGLNLYLVWTYPTPAGEMVLGAGRHVHPYGECFVFTGLDYNNPNHLSAEIEVEMGDEGEKHVLKSPGVIIFPAGFPHAPIVIRNAHNIPFGGMMVYLGGEYTHTNVPIKAGTTPAGKKYAHLVKKMELRDMKRKSGGNADFIAGLGGKTLEGLNLNFTWAFHTGLGAWHDRDPHVHPYDEALLFVGLDPTNPDYLGAEIQIAMGEEQEIHVFDTPTVVVAPGGLVHCPLITRRVDKPYSFSAICLNGEHDTTWLGKEK
jgi:hypothetical protein